MALPGIAAVADIHTGVFEGPDPFIGPLDGAGVVGGPVVDEYWNVDPLEMGSGGDVAPEVGVLPRCAVAALDPGCQPGAARTRPRPVVVERPGLTEEYMTAASTSPGV